MKKNSIYALMGAIALAGSVGFSSCSSSSDDIIDNPDYIPEDKAVKTQFAISIPSNVNAPTTRMSIAKVQEADNSFRGMKDITLVPFVSKPTAAANETAGAPITLGDIGSTGGVTQLGETTGNYKVYSNITVPLGTSAFLFYAQADGSTDGDFVNGKTVKTDPATAGTAGYTFSPSPIYDVTAGNTKGNAIATYLTSIATATGWSASSGTLKTYYDQFIKLTAGSSASIQLAVTNLWKEVKGGTDAVSSAIVGAITNATYVSATSTDALTFTDAVSGYPANLNLPDGAAAVKWDATSSRFDVDNSGNTVGTLGSYVYPASLWYTANTEIKVSNTKLADEAGKYPSGRTAWDNSENGVLALYTNGTQVTPNSRSIALTEQIQYAVGRLDVTVKCAAATLYDQQGAEVAVKDEGFPVSAILIGGQKPVDFTFSNPSGTDLYTIYDKEVSGVYAKNGSPEGKNYTLTLETEADADVNIAIELTNNTETDFYGKNGQLIPKGGKFYLTTTLSSASATTTANKIFKQDYYTIANLTILAGNSGATNTTGLATATNTIPDLRTPALELGLAVDLHWQAGNTFDIDI